MTTDEMLAHIRSSFAKEPERKEARVMVDLRALRLGGAKQKAKTKYLDLFSATFPTFKVEAEELPRRHQGSDLITDITITITRP